MLSITVKPVLSSHSKRRPKLVFQDRLSPNAGQKYCRMLQGEHSVILLTFIKLQFVIKIFVLSTVFLGGRLRQVFTVLLDKKIIMHFLLQDAAAAIDNMVSRV